MVSVHSIKQINKQERTNTLRPQARGNEDSPGWLIPMLEIAHILFIQVSFTRLSVSSTPKTWCRWGRTLEDDHQHRRSPAWGCFKNAQVESDKRTWLWSHGLRLWHGDILVWPLRHLAVLRSAARWRINFPSVARAFGGKQR